MNIHAVVKFKTRAAVAARAHTDPARAGSAAGDLREGSEKTGGQTVHITCTHYPGCKRSETTAVVRGRRRRAWASV